LISFGRLNHLAEISIILSTPLPIVSQVFSLSDMHQNGLQCCGEEKLNNNYVQEANAIRGVKMAGTGSKKMAGRSENYHNMPKS
jgi:hypothetical protein